MLPQVMHKPHAGERRRRYVVTVASWSGESPQQTDERLCRMLGVEPGKTYVTVTVYEPASNAFRSLNTKKRAT